ncbi:AAAS [Linum perenne]
MPSFPQPGSVTICEINRQLIADEIFSDDRARETYGKLLGTVFSPVQFQADQLVSPEQEPELQGRSNGDNVGRNVLGKAFQGLVNLLPEVGLQGVSWHQHKHIIAFVSGQNQVTVCDYEDSGNAAVGRSGITSYLGTVSGGSGSQWALVDFLRSTNNEQVTALSWSPDGRYPIHLLI